MSYQMPKEYIKCETKVNFRYFVPVSNNVILMIILINFETFILLSTSRERKHFNIGNHI